MYCLLFNEKNTILFMLEFTYAQYSSLFHALI